MSDSAGRAAGAASAPAAQRRFTPGPGLLVVAAGALLVVVLALAAVVTASLGARGASAVMGGTALIVLGVGLIVWLRVPARSLVVNAPRLRLERNRARVAQRAQVTGAAVEGVPWDGPAPTGSGSASRGGVPARGHGPVQEHGAGLSHRVLGTDLGLPASTGRRELTTRDVVTGPVSTLLASTRLGVAADEHLAGTSTGEAALRVLQLLAGCLGFVLVALGLASVLGQVLR